MNDEQKKWSKQFAANNGAKEFFRLSCVFLTWIFISVTLFIAIGLVGYSSKSINLIFTTILLMPLVIFPFIVHRWKPAYSILRKILGNENLPKEPFPRSNTKDPRQPLPWWSYLPSIWWILIDLLLLYAVIKYLSK